VESKAERRAEKISAKRRYQKTQNKLAERQYLIEIRLRLLMQTDRN